MAPFRYFFPFGIWIAGAMVWTGVMVIAISGENASAKPRPASAVTQPKERMIGAPELERAMGSFVSIYRQAVECPDSDCMTLDLHFTALTEEAAPKSAGEWIAELNTWFHPSQSRRLFVFRFRSWTPLSIAKEGGCSLLIPSSGSSRARFAKAANECSDRKSVNPEAINIFVVKASKPTEGESGAYGQLNEFHPFVRAPAADLSDVAPGGKGWKLHLAMREALGLPVSGGGRSPAFSASETEILIGNIEKVFNRLHPSESISSMSFDDE